MSTLMSVAAQEALHKRRWAVMSGSTPEKTMRLMTRPFSEARDDFRRLWEFLEADYVASGDDFSWLMSRLGDWRYGPWTPAKRRPTFCGDHGQLWVDAFDRVHGVLLSENGDGQIFALARWGCPWLAGVMMAWAQEHWAPRWGTLTTEINPRRGEGVALAARGFIKGEGAGTTYAYDLTRDRADEPLLPDGFRVEARTVHRDHAGLVRLYRAGFGGTNVVTDEDLESVRQAQQNPAQEPACDFSVIAPDGRHASTCVGFHFHRVGAAEVEKVCTDPDFRRRGLAEACIRRCFQELKVRGIRRAYITGYPGGGADLYGKLNYDVAMPLESWRWEPSG